MPAINQTNSEEKPDPSPLNDWSKFVIDTILICWHSVATNAILALVAKNLPSTALLLECSSALDNHLAKLLDFVTIHKLTSSTVKQCMKLFIQAQAMYDTMSKCFLFELFTSFCSL